VAHVAGVRRIDSGGQAKPISVSSAPGNWKRTSAGRKTEARKWPDDAELKPPPPPPAPLQL
jgi:hypothetical protein